MVENVVGIDACHSHVDALDVRAFDHFAFLSQSSDLPQAEIVARTPVDEVAAQHGTVKAQLQFGFLRLLSFPNRRYLERVA